MTGEIRFVAAFAGDVNAPASAVASKIASSLFMGFLPVIHNLQYIFTVSKVVCKKNGRICETL